MSSHMHMTLIWMVCLHIVVYELITFVGVVWFAFPVHFPAIHGWPLKYRRQNIVCYVQMETDQQWICNYRSSDIASCCPIPTRIRQWKLAYRHSWICSSCGSHRDTSSEVDLWTRIHDILSKQTRPSSGIAFNVSQRQHHVTKQLPVLL